MRKKILAFVACLAVFVGVTLGLVRNVNAAGTIDCCGTEVFGTSCPEELNNCGPEQNEDYVLEKVKKVITFLTVLVGTISSVVIVMAGITYMTAVGDPAKMTKAKMAIMAAVIGLVVTICAYAITALVVSSLTE